jgi:DNA-binding transcriptional MerR regulator
VTVAGAAAAAGSPAGRDLMSIGEVLAHLRTEFPDTTISKLRFLEAEGLVEPQRTPSGYRKYRAEDIARLRFVLTAQRDHYLPLRVIREHLAALDAGEMPAGLEGLPRSTLTPVASPADGSGRVRTGPPGEVRLTRTELAERAGVTESELSDLEEHGLLPVRGGARGGGWYDADALTVVTVAAQLARYGVQPRHLRAYRAAADREVGFFTQLVAPQLRQSDPAARARAAEMVRELTGLAQRLQAALVRAGLRGTLGG